MSIYLIAAEAVPDAHRLVNIGFTEDSLLLCRFQALQGVVEIIRQLVMPGKHLIMPEAIVQGFCLPGPSEQLVCVPARKGHVCGDCGLLCTTEQLVGSAQLVPGDTMDG